MQPNYDVAKSLKSLEGRLGFIGGGNMAKAIAEGIVRKGLLPYSKIHVSGPHLENLKWWEKNGAHVSTSNGKVAEETDVVFLSIKPHLLAAAVANIYDTGNVQRITNKLFVSILAGVKLESLESILGSFEGSRVIRVMPNTPMMVGEGCTVYCPGQKALEQDILVVKTILEVSGICKLVPESMINAVGGLAGCGPAYIYLVIEAMSDGAVKQGVPRAMATEFAAQTVLGAAKMVLESGKHTGALKDEVCSPGGSTITGIHALEKAGVRSAFMDAIEAATKKSSELGQKK